MRLNNVGSQYLIANVDADGTPFDGAKTYRLKLPKGIPAARFWSITLYDNQTRSMLQTAQLYPRAGSQMFPTPAAEAETDGSTVVHFSPPNPTVWRPATGSRLTRRGVGSPPCASTARFSRSSTRPGDPANSSP